MSIRKSSAMIVDKAEVEQEGDPPPDDDGDISTPKTQPPSDDDKPLEQGAGLNASPTSIGRVSS